MNLKTLLKREEPADEGLLEPRHEHCLSCGADLDASHLYERYRVCHSCGFHFHLNARERLATILDPGTFHEDDRGVTSIDPISFQGRQSYRSRVINAQRRTGLAESALTGTGAIFGREVVIAVLDFAFLGGSIGIVAGERLARAFEKAAARRAPVITVCSTAGTRMQEGLLALMQVPRVIAAAQKFSDAGLPHIAVLTDPTTGSAYAGFVSLADVLIAEPNALIGYAALGELQENAPAELPPGAHTSESQLEHGLIDAIVPRPQLREALSQLLDLLMNDYRLSARDPKRDGRSARPTTGAWRQVQISRHEQRPGASDLIGRMVTSFVELHGDRVGTDDASIVAGIASLGGEAVVIVGQERRREGAEPNGWITAGGFRKAERAFGLAGKFGLPVITLIDCAGALPAVENELAGLGSAIAGCMATMLSSSPPTIAVITGEGSSEAAVAMAVADRVLMLENAVYEVLRPEDAARILYQQPGLAEQAAERLRLTSTDCLRLGIIDATVPEPGEGAHTDHAEAAVLVRRSILRELTRLNALRTKTRLQRRYERYREIGSTRSKIRGTLERRMAHVADRIGGAWERLARRNLRRRTDFDEDANIAV
jgi:acetyl-CoA carboxylase carboxyl transferase subunit beta